MTIANSSFNLAVFAPFVERPAQNSNLSFLPDLHSLDLFKGQPVPGSIINPGGRRTCMAGDPLRDLDGAARIHVFGNAVARKL